MANSSFFKSSGTSSTTESTIETQVNNASTSATNAASSATAAASSASAASTSETNASSSATSASSSASTAQTHANTATTKANEAATSASTASTHAGTATTKAGEASTSASSASGSATTATTQAGLSSDHRADAGKYAVTNHNTTFSLSSTNGGTSGLYSAKHYATEASNSATSAANSATSASNTASSIGDLDSLSDVTIASVADNEILQYNNSNSKWENQTLAEAGILTSETFTSLVQDTSPQLGGTLDANSNVIDMGSNNITDTKVGQWDTAYGWGNHASSSYLTANQTITLSGDASGSGTTAITVTVADDSHNHIIGNVDGLQTALDAKAPLASPDLTGNPTAPTQSASDNSTKIATTAYTDTAISNLVDTSPAALNTLNELAAALGDDANFSTTVTNSIATKLNSSAVSTFGGTLIDDANAAAARTTLGLGTAATTASTAYATAAQGTTADAALAASAVSTFGGTLIDDADAATARTTLGLGTSATTASTAYATASHTQASSTITDFATAASAEAIPFAIALG